MPTGRRDRAIDDNGDPPAGSMKKVTLPDPQSPEFVAATSLPLLKLSTPFAFCPARRKRSGHLAIPGVDCNAVVSGIGDVEIAATVCRETMESA